MALALRSLHDLPSLTGNIDRRYPLGDAPVVQPSALGINLAAFNAAAFTFTNYRVGGVAVDFNYRQFLTGSSAASATLSVNSASGVLGNWTVDASGNGISNNLTASGAGQLFVSASNGVDPPVSFPVQEWSILSAVQQNAVKLPRGNGLWPNNQFWRGTAGQVYRNNILPLLKSNINLNVVVMAMSWADMEGATRGDYSPAFNSIQAVLNDLSAITTHKVWVIVKGWLTYFGPASSPPSRTSTACWPQYVVNNGWTTNFIQNGAGRSQLTWDVDDVWAALTSLYTAIGAQFNSHPNFGGCGFQDETEAVSVIDKVTQPAPWGPGSTVINSTHYNAKLLQLFYAMSDSMPNTLTYVPWNFLPPGGSQEVTDMSNMINQMLATRPGKWLFGGPDPWTHNTTYHKLACGLVGTTGDIRAQVAQLSNCEQGKETAGGTPLSTIYATGISSAAPVASPQNTPGRSQILIWDYIPDSQSGQVITITPILNQIAAQNGQVAANPVVGTYV